MAKRVDNRVWGVCGGAIARRGDVWYTQHSFGRVVDELADRVRAVQYHGPQAVSAACQYCDYPLSKPNITLCPGPAWRSSLDAVFQGHRVLREYWRMNRRCDVLFLRGSLPLLWTVHLMAAALDRPVVHWIVGDPVMIMRGESRGYGRALTLAGLQFARWERLLTQLTARMSGAAILANGAELARVFRSARTSTVVSTTITDHDFRVRDDTCQGNVIRILFVGFVRPEKGLEYLIRAMRTLDADRPVHLTIAGPWDQFSDERERLMRLVDCLGLRDRITWRGYVPFGSSLHRQMDDSDLLVLPSLSEGTPRVLIEARARSLPVIATRVGGIPTSVTDSVDGLLVPPRDATALARSISRMISDVELRRRLIWAGRETVRRFTLEQFIELVLQAVQPSASRPGARGASLDRAFTGGPSAAEGS